MFPKGFGLAELTRYQRRWNRLLGGIGKALPRPPTRLREVGDFGPNPGALRMLAYVPPGLPEGAPLVVVLHGCKQNAALYDRGTGWSALAARHRFAVLFPEQCAANNSRLCFNWFQPADVARNGGEAASVDAMIGWMLRQHRLDPRRVHVTGLSAGAAMAAALMAVLPERFESGAIIAGVPFGAARTVGEALHAMFHARRRGSAEWATLAREAAGSHGPWPRISIWQGELDETVVPANALELEKQWTVLHGLDTAPAVDVADGHPRRRWRDAAGRVLVESRSIAGLAHGTPIAARHAGPGGRVAMRFGRPSDFVLDVGVSSTWRIAQFWGLVPQREEAPAPAPRAEAAATRKAPKAKPAAARKRRATARAKLLPGFDPGLGLRLALAPMAAFRRMLRGRRRR
ncbi:MAG: Esterase, depolymerase family [Roseomonas sp.]|nr:Esterase, depolymerase family [Roseomonas sp.]